MNLIPFRRRSIEDLQNDINSFFDDSLFNLTKSSDNQTLNRINNWFPETDIYDSGDKLVVKTDLPGLKKEDIDIRIQGNTLFIKGEKKHEDKVKDMGYLKAERFYGSFERALPLKEHVKADDIEAKYQDGVLTVLVPKKEEAVAKQIKINVK